MSWTFDNNKPIYIQLMDKIKKQIVSGEIQQGERLQSVRDLATEAGVNPNTMQRALSEMEREGLIFSQRTSGRFVTENIEDIEEKRKNMAKEIIDMLIVSLMELGYSKEKLIKIIMEVWESEANENDK